ncbi:MAG: glycosyltransferase [Candidatus Thermoplasmatota archaeon]
MKIVFFGHQKFLDYFQIGGFESFVRRLATFLSNNGCVVDYVMYGCHDEKEIAVNSNLFLKYFISFENALQALEKPYEHVFPIKIDLNKRLQYIQFLRKNNLPTRFHYFALVWPKLVKRGLMLLETSLFSKNGKIFCISPRLYDLFKRFFKKTVFIWPSVPEIYYLSPDKKPKNNSIKITYLGNLITDKYIEEIVELFMHQKKRGNYELTIYGTFDPLNEKSVSIHKKLLKQKEIKYIHIDRESYSSDTELLVIRVLKETDVLFQPYKTLINTLDTPLLLLEAMASLCAVVTTKIGNVKDIYGESPFILSRENFFDEAMVLLERLNYEMILTERERIWGRNKMLQFDLENVGRRFMETLL